MVSSHYSNTVSYYIKTIGHNLQYSHPFSVLHFVSRCHLPSSQGYCGVVTAFVSNISRYSVEVFKSLFEVVLNI